MQRTATAGSTAASHLIQGGRRGLAAPSLPGSDAELLAEFTASADPMSGRTVMRVLGVGWLRAKRLADLAGWTASTRPPLPDSGNRPSGTQPTNRSEAEDDETKPADHAKTRTTP